MRMSSTSTTPAPSPPTTYGAAVAGPPTCSRRWSRPVMPADTLALTPRPVASSVEELLRGASHREPFLTSDSKSGSGFERVVIDGEQHVLKHVHPDRDWTMRFNNDVGCHPVQVWAAGLMDALPRPNRPRHRRGRRRAGPQRLGRGDPHARR